LRVGYRLERKRKIVVIMPSSGGRLNILDKLAILANLEIVVKDLVDLAMISAVRILGERF
jgi:hypothetical protein